MTDFYKMTKNFILGEGYNPPDAMTYIQAINEALSGINPASQTEARRLTIARENLKNLRRETRRLQEKLAVLEEQINESNKKKNG